MARQSDDSQAARLSRRSLLLAGLGTCVVALGAACQTSAPPAPTAPVAPTAAPTRAPVPTSVPVPTAALAPVAATPLIQAPPAAVKQGGEWVFASQADANSLEPHADLTNVRIYVTTLVYDNLVAIDQKLQLKPALAESWTIAPDNKTYTFKLRKGVKFHNGRDFTADDVIYTYNRILDPQLNASQKVDLQAIDSMNAPDPYTLVLTTKDIFGEFLTALAGFSTMIVPKEVVQQYGDLRKVAIGTGPFILDDWKPGSYIKLKKNTDHWAAASINIDRMTIPIIPDEQSVLAQLRAGSVHSYLLGDLKNVATLRNDPSLVLQQASTLQTDILVFNCGKPPFNDQKLRQAFCYAVDRQKVLDVGAAGLGHLTGPLPPSMPPWGQPGEDYPLNHVDKDKARALLKEAGKDTGFTTTIINGTTNPQARGVLNSQVIADELSQVGVQVNIEMLEPTLWQKRFAKPVYDFELSSNSIIGYLGPDAYLYFRFNHDGFNQPNINNPDIEQILLQGRTTIDQTQRVAIYKKAQQVLVDFAPYIWLYTNDNYYVHQPSVKGFVPDPAGRWITASSVWLDK